MSKYRLKTQYKPGGRGEFIPELRFWEPGTYDENSTEGKHLAALYENYQYHNVIEKIVA